MSLRDDIVANALWGAAHEPDIHYTMGAKRMSAVRHPRELPMYADCSAFVTCCYAWAGAPDPNGLGYNGTGYTGSLLLNLERIDPAEMRAGDLIVFGPGPGDHVVIAIEDGRDPMTVSHGQEKGPFKIRLSVEARAHRPPMTCLRGAGLDNDTPAPLVQEDDEMPKQSVFNPPAGHKDAGTYVLGAHGYHDAVRVLDPDHLTRLTEILGPSIELEAAIWDQLVIVEPTGHQ